MSPTRPDAGGEGAPLAGLPGAERIIDAHVHVWGTPHPEAAATWHRPHTVERLLATLDAAGVERAIQVTPSPERWENSYGLEAAAAHPQRLGVFGRLDPTAPEPERRLAAWMARAGVRGVRLTSFGEHAAAAGELVALEPFWAAAERLRTPVSLFAPDCLHEAAAVLERHPGLRLIVDHLGLGVYPGCADPFAGMRALGDLASFEHVRVKVSGLVEVSAEPFPFRDVHEHLAAALETFGARRLIWGSNHPVVAAKCDYAESLGYLRHCEFLLAEDLRWMLTGTITALLER
ncbi:MAG: amidohydrolase family protein [Solirubrobacteraceae bacterium]